MPQPRFWIEDLKLGLGLWEGTYRGIDQLWLRWFDALGNWSPTSLEQEAPQAERERQRVEQERHAPSRNTSGLNRRNNELNKNTSGPSKNASGLNRKDSGPIDSWSN